MKTLLFNTHDIALLFTAYICVLFAFCVCVLKTSNKRSNYWLAAFLISYSAIPLDTVINFGAGFRQVAIDFSPNIFFIFGHAYWLESVFLLFYIRSLIYKNFRLKLGDLALFVPFVLYASYEIYYWYLLDHETKLAFLNGYQLANEASFKFAINLFRECFRVFCGILCLIELTRYQRHLKNQLSEIKSVNLIWLRTLVVGFLLVRLIAVFVTLGYILTIHWGVTVSYGEIGLISNWLVLMLVSALIFYSLSRTTVFQAHRDTKNTAKLEVSDTQIQQLKDVMENHKPYLDHYLSLERLAQQLDMTPRQLSLIINRHFNKNFFEFINDYRVEESKQLLSQPQHSTTSMLDIMALAGFNSKATFNTFFKKTVGQTPSQYKKQQAKSAHGTELATNE